MRPYVLVARNVKIINLGGSVVVNDHSRGNIQIGFYQVGTEDRRYNRFIWNNNGNVIFQGNAKLGSGTKISNSGELIFGRNFVITSNSTIIGTKKIVFGDDCLVSWECLFMDSDFHKIYDIYDVKMEKQLNPNKPIVISNNVWFGCRVTVLKGTEVKEGVVVAAGSVLHKKYESEYAIINDEGIIHNNIKWKY